MRHSVFATILASLSLAIAGSASAQTADASVTAEVQQPITVTKNRDLDFGNVFPGVNKTIEVNDATSASFAVTGQASTQVHLTFVLPSTLTSGANSLVIDTWTARHNTTNSSESGSDFTPSSTATAATLSSSGELYVFVGATVEPTVTQVAGTYSGTASMTVVYF